LPGKTGVIRLRNEIEASAEAFVPYRKIYEKGTNN
jgi:hypothetical protein